MNCKTAKLIYARRVGILFAAFVSNTAWFCSCGLRCSPFLTLNTFNFVRLASSRSAGLNFKMAGGELFCRFLQEFSKLQDLTVESRQSMFKKVQKPWKTS